MCIPSIESSIRLFVAAASKLDKLGVGRSRSWPRRTGLVHLHGLLTEGASGRIPFRKARREGTAIDEAHRLCRRFIAA
jgi:hypothetical protein